MEDLRVVGIFDHEIENALCLIEYGNGDDGTGLLLECEILVGGLVEDVVVDELHEVTQVRVLDLLDQLPHIGLLVDLHPLRPLFHDLYLDVIDLLVGLVPLVIPP